MNSTSTPQNSLFTQISRACRLRCPRCAEDRLFKSWLTMKESCDACGFNFRRDPGFYLGAIYFNYGLTAVLVTATYIACWIFTDLGKEAKLGIALIPALLVPFLFFRYARSLWLGFDYYFDASTRES